MSLRVRSENDRLIVFAGDIHGEFDTLDRQLRSVIKTHGPIDAVIAVGDVQAIRGENDAASMLNSPRHPAPLDFYKFANGERELPAPLYFIGGNHEPWEALDAAGPGTWAPNVFFLGRSGTTNIGGLDVAFLSGIYSARITEQNIERITPKQRTYFLRSEVEALAKHTGPVDVLLTHDWPTVEGEVPGYPINFNPGNDMVRGLSTALHPRLHVAGHHHRRVLKSVGETELLTLARTDMGMDSLAAFTVSPQREMQPLELRGAERSATR